MIAAFGFGGGAVNAAGAAGRAAAAGGWR